jgi:hypothetical protein
VRRFLGVLPVAELGVSCVCPNGRLCGTLTLVRGVAAGYVLPPHQIGHSVRYRAIGTRERRDPPIGPPLGVCWHGRTIARCECVRGVRAQNQSGGQAITTSVVPSVEGQRAE